jgi:anaerobic dimethyl sulfoxide reductase subunit B (iron-sulfur subunit)
MAKQLGFYVNIAACTGCKACQIACKDKSSLPVGVNWRRVFEYEGGEWVDHNGTFVPSNVYAYFVSSACMHCEKALCIDVCPAKAISRRDDGIILIDQDKCIGCRYCEWACPYSAPQFNEETGIMSKCNFCYDLVDQGQKPACVDGCPFRALDFGEIDELRAKYGTVDNAAPMPDPSITHPSIVFGVTSVTETSAQPSGTIGNVEEAYHGSP